MAARLKREHVVKALMTREPDTVKKVTSRKGSARQMSCWVYACPRKNRCKNTPPVVSFEKGTGWTNPYSHLISCVAIGDEAKLMELYRVSSTLSLQDGEDGRISSYFETNLSSTDRERAMFHCIDIIVSLSLPITYVENARFRDFSKFSERISIKAFRKTVFKLMEIVEMGVRKDLEGTRGAVMHDAWTKNESHFLGIFAVYGCNLNNEYIALHSVHSPSSVFESGDVKIQRNEIDTLTDEERAACAALKKPVDTNANGNHADEGDGSLSMAEIFEKRKRRRRSTEHRYMNLDFLIGSSAEIERLFSLAGGILASNRQSMTPLLFESLLFLKVNRGYWDAKTVVVAMSSARSDIVAKRVAEDAEQEELQTI